MKVKDIQTNLNEEINLSDPEVNFDVILEELDPKLLVWDIRVDDELIDINLSEEVVLPTQKPINKIGLLAGDIKNKISQSYWDIKTKYTPKKVKKLKIIRVKHKKFNAGVFQKLSTGYQNIGFLWGYKTKKVLSIVLLLLLLIICNLIFIGILTQQGYKKLFFIKSHPWNITQISDQIDTAERLFWFAELFITPVAIIPNKYIDNAEKIIDGWKNISQVLWSGVKLFLEIQNTVEKQWIDNIYYTDVLRNHKAQLDSISESLYNGLVSYSKVTYIWKTSDKKRFSQVLEKGKDIYSKLDIVLKNFDTSLSLLWDTSPKKYLIVLQNNDEIRATGWFMGTLWLIEFNKWKIINFGINDTYNYEWKINKAFPSEVTVPKGLEKIAWKLRLRDANFEYNFEKNSEFIKQRLQLIDIDIHGVIYLNKSIILDLLEKIGPIDVNNTTITHENFSLIMSFLVEAKLDKQWTLGSPKQSLFDFNKIFISKLKEKKLYFEYINIIYKHLKTRDLVIHSFSPEENSLLWKLWMNGNVKFWETLDFNLPIFSSNGWNKTDRYIDLEISKDFKRNSNCSIDTNLTLTRFHSFDIQKENKVMELINRYNIAEKQKLLYVQGKADNSVFTQVFLPKTSIIHNANSYEIEEGKNYKKLSFSMITKQWNFSTNNISYTIPNPECTPYEYIQYKQPGIKKYDITINGNNYENIQTDFIYNN